MSTFVLPEGDRLPQASPEGSVNLKSVCFLGRAAGLPPVALFYITMPVGRVPVHPHIPACAPYLP